MSTPLISAKAGIQSSTLEACHLTLDPRFRGGERSETYAAAFLLFGRTSAL
jgi:hypothetical protein